jgi:CheY-like chemotaxis protein
LVSENVVLQFIQLEHKHPIRAQQHLLSLGRFLGDIAHAMSNPLAVLQGRVELLLHKSAQYPQDLKRHFSSMFEQCARITDQLHLIQILSKKKTFSPQPLSIQKQLRHFMKSYQGSGVLELGTNTEAHILFASVQFQVIVAQLVHVLSEKFSQPIRIRFELIEEGLDVCLSFIFDQAAQDPVLLSLADGGSFSSIKGRDVRFFLCSLLMEHQGGSLSFYAKKKSYYALLRFPLYTPKSDDNLSSLLRIMVIDDHSNLRETLSALLAKEGHHLAAVPSAEDAMELMAQSLFDVVISDIRLPGISGLELYELMSHSNPEMAKKMILISGIRQHLDQQKIPFLRKPFSKSELLRLIKKIVSPE